MRELIIEASHRLRRAGVASPEADARLLLAHACAVEPSRLPVLDQLDPDQAERFTELIRRRSERVPLQHLTGRAYFRRIEVAVGPGVFVPRPETEVMTGWVIEHLTGLVTAGRTPLVIELGTGSGAIVKAIADEVPGCELITVEHDQLAAEWAARNLAGTGVELIEGDMARLSGDWDGRCDVVISNPPYIPLEAFESVTPEVRDHDPELALFSGTDGLDAIRVVVRVAARLLGPSGLVAIEHADLQGDAVVGILADSGDFNTVRDHPDLTGRSRFSTAVRRGKPGGVWQDCPSE